MLIIISTKVMLLVNHQTGHTAIQIKQKIEKYLQNHYINKSTSTVSDIGIGIKLLLVLVIRILVIKHL